MEQNTVVKESDDIYPLLFIPKKCTRLETNCEASDNVFIDLKITSQDTEGHDTCIYSGFCNIKLIDTYDVNIQQGIADELYSHEDIDDSTPVIIASTGNVQPSYSQSEVWIDPSRSPFVYNHCDALESQTHYSVCQQTHTTSRITFEQQHTYITKNVFNYKEAVHYASLEEDNKKFVNIKKNKFNTQQHNSDPNIYEEEELECGLFLSQLPEEIMHEKETKDKEEIKYIGLNSDNGALKQLMSTDIQSISKQRKTILFLGQDSRCGQTIQKIAYTDPFLECSESSRDAEPLLIFDSKKQPRHKKYQCAKCSTIFDHISQFRDHVSNHAGTRHVRPPSDNDDLYMCIECGKYLRSRQKYEKHCLAHGNPDLECDKCHKVFASKFTLRVHGKLHDRKYPCVYCPKTFSYESTFKRHLTKKHSTFNCSSCDFIASNHTDLMQHQKVHEVVYSNSSETDLAESLFDDVMSESEAIAISPENDWIVDKKNLISQDEDMIINQVQETPSDDATSKMMVEDFFAVTKENGLRKFDKSPLISQDEDMISQEQPTPSEDADAATKIITEDFFTITKGNGSRRYNKTCHECCKTFDRISDLKRHLIEHVVRNTLSKTPVNKNGKLHIQCEVCQQETFTRVDRYKAHLREHAKLTLYQCTFCNKSFSDSSNFSKHKKIHGTSYFQCDLCKRKFNSKQMITQHMEYHNKHAPLPCCYCSKEFHFESMLNKHIKVAHTKVMFSRFRCRFCHKYFKTLKEKWDHEWGSHSARQIVADCLICGAKFRKYAELKKHCQKKHGMDIPTAKTLLNDKTKAEPLG